MRVPADGAGPQPGPGTATRAASTISTSEKLGPGGWAEQEAAPPFGWCTAMLGDAGGQALRVFACEENFLHLRPTACSFGPTEHYMDWTGAALYWNSQVAAAARELETTAFGARLIVVLSRRLVASARLWALVLYHEARGAWVLAKWL